MGLKTFLISRLDYYYFQSATLPVPFFKKKIIIITRTCFVPEHGNRNYLWQFCSSILSPAPKSQQAFWISAGIDWKIGLIIHKGSDLRSVNIRLLEILAASLGQWVVSFFSLKAELKVISFFLTPSYYRLCILRTALVVGVAGRGAVVHIVSSRLHTE